MAGSVEVGRGHVTLTAETSQLTRGLQTARAAFTSFVSNITTGLAQGLGQQLFQTITNGIRSAFGVIQQGVKDASDLTETINKIGVAFGSSSKEIIAWSQNSDTALGQSQTQALNAAASFGLLFKNIGLGVKPAADMSEQLVQLATDLGSIYNIPIGDALAKLQAGLIGEIRPLRDVNIFLTENAVQQKAMQLGLADTVSAITEQDKVMARYALILEQGAIANGDFARTSGELANSQKILQAQLTKASTSLGQFFLPVQLAFTKGFSDLLTQMAPFGTKIMESFAQGLADGIVAITPILAQLRTFFTYWLESHSPPRLLPDLAKWGTAAMQAYLEGWSLADFDALRDLGGTIEGILRSFVGTGDIAETDIVGRVFGSQKAIAAAIREFRNLGSVSQETLNGIARAAGPAGAEIANLVGQYFELQKAAGKVADAQEELNGVTQKYADALRPINDQLDAVRDKQDEIRNNQRLQDLGKTLVDPTKTADEHQLARLEIQQIELEKQAGAIEKERDVAVDASQAKIDAAKKEEDAAQAKFNVAQAALDQQVKTNNLIGEEIALRTRLADEAINAQKRALADLEAEQRKADAANKERLAELERIHQAQLGFNLANTDTAGQLALLQGELDRTTKGSADYFDILTRMLPLQKKLAEELKASQDAAAEAAALAANRADTGGVAEQQVSAGITNLTSALDKAFAALSGSDGKEVKLNPFFQGLADTITNIGIAAKNAKPAIQGIIDLFTGKGESGQLDTTTDPLVNVPGLKGFIPGLNTLINALGLLKTALATGDWAPVWSAFTKGVSDILNGIDPNADPSTFSFYLWLNDTLIPAINALAIGDWTDALQLLSAPIDAWVDNAFKQGSDWMKNLFDGIKDYLDTFGAAREAEIEDILNNLFGWLIPDAPKSGPPDPNKGQPQDVLPPNNNSSFPGTFPGLAPSPLAASTINNAAGDTVVFNIEQNIGSSGDFGGARSGALEGIRQALLTRKLGTT